MQINNQKWKRTAETAVTHGMAILPNKISYFRSLLIRNSVHNTVPLLSKQKTSSVTRKWISTSSWVFLIECSVLLTTVLHIHNKVCLYHPSRNSVNGSQGDGTKWSSALMWHSIYTWTNVIRQLGKWMFELVNNDFFHIMYFTFGILYFS